MSSYLIVGLESSTTKLVAQLIAYNLDITKSIKEWKGDWSISNDKHSVTHRSIPHSDSDIYTTSTDCADYDFIIIVTRDWYSSLKSKISTHQPNVGLATLEHLRGRQCLVDIIEKYKYQINHKMFFFSYETAFILKKAYIESFLISMGFVNPKLTRIKDINGKYHDF